MVEKETQGTSPQTTPATTTQDDGDKVTLSRDELRALLNQAKEEAVKRRFKNREAPQDDDLAAKLEAAQRRVSELEEAGKSELEKAMARQRKAEERAAALEAETAKKLSESQERYRERVKRETIARYAAENKIPGADHFVKVTADMLQVSDDESVWCEDADTGKRLNVKEALDAFRAKPGNEIFNPAPPGGSGGRAGSPRGMTHKSPGEMEAGSYELQEAARAELFGKRPIPGAKE